MFATFAFSISTPSFAQSRATVNADPAPTTRVDPVIVNSPENAAVMP